VLRTIFLGDTSRHEVQLESGDIVQVRADGRPEPELGARLAVGTVPGGGVAVRDDEPAVPEPGAVAD
jgi:hypothetical protein